MDTKGLLKLRSLIDEFEDDHEDIVCELILVGKKSVKRIEFTED